VESAPSARVEDALRYGSEEELKKVTNDFGRCATALKKGASKPLPGDGGAAALAGEFGYFHYGWKDDRKGNKLESVAPVAASVVERD